MNKTAILETVGVDRKEGVAMAVQKVEQFVMGSENHLAAANTIITGLGGRSENNSDRARIVAKTMVAQVIAKKAPDQEAARVKADKLLTAEPYLKRDEINETAESKPALAAKPSKTGRRKGAGNDKHAKADAFIEANKDKFTDRGDLVRATAAELGTDYAGAYFYVKRAETKFGLQLTSRKGRKPKAKVEVQAEPVAETLAA